jgi:Kinesin motor domain
VDKSFNGLSFTLITYGISGSGKTHTTFGSKKDDQEWEDGLLFYTAKKVFRCRDEIKKFKGLNIKASFIEIYNENVYDLLSKDSENKLVLTECGLT